jgi:hypothetical protein
MAKPLTKGPPIGIRLPLDIHQRYLERAEANGETIGRYLERRLVDADMKTSKAKQLAPDILRALECGHKRTEIRGGGVKACLDCTAVNSDGKGWRLQ